MSLSPEREYQFDGLCGPTHNYGGLSLGNLASTKHRGLVSNPRAALFQGLEKMKFVSSLGVGQALLPPQERPSLRVLRSLGFTGSDAEVIAQAAKSNEHLLRLVSSSSSMWTANAATVCPSADAGDRNLHFVPANLESMFHRSIEPATTTRVLRKIFSNSDYFVVHDPLPTHFSDEGAANHTRFKTEKGVVHLLAWGRSQFDHKIKSSVKFPARQTFEASKAIVRAFNLKGAEALFPQQLARGIDAGAFHTDVLAVGNQNFLMAHEFAFKDQKNLMAALKKGLGKNFWIYTAKNSELSVANAVKAYPFNSQVLSLDDGSMAIIAPLDSRENKQAHKFLEQVKESDGPVKEVHYLDVRQSMQNGGGPACLRLRVILNQEERIAISANIFYSEDLHQKLKTWGNKFYRDQLHPRDLSDPQLALESMQGLDELSQILKLGSIYDFQR